MDENATLTDSVTISIRIIKDDNTPDHTGPDAG